MTGKRAGAGVLNLWPWLAAVLTGALATVALAPFEQMWTCWIALTPLLAAIWFSGDRAKRRGVRDLLLGYVAGLTFFWSAFFWLRTVTVPGLILVGLYMAVYFALWGWFAGLVRPRLVGLLPETRQAGRLSAESGRMPDSRGGDLHAGKLREEGFPAPDEPAPAPARGRAWPPPQPGASSPKARSPWLSSLRNLGLAAILACAWTALEWVRGWLFSGWGWNGLGVPLHGVLPMIQIAQFTGVAGLTFVVVFVNVIAIVTVRRFVAETKVQKRRPHYDFTLPMVGLVGICAYGIRVLAEHPATKPLRVAAVQADVPREEKFSQQYQGKTFMQFARLTRLALATKPPPDLIMWPESSMPAPVLEDESNFRFVMNVAGSMNSDLLLGSLDEDEQGDYNAALLVAGRVASKPQVYRKLHLVPFGEYVPGRNTVPFIARIVGDQVPADFTRGKEPVVFHLTNGMKVAPLICFEDTLGDLTRQFVLRGAQLLANVTNDGWFLQSAAAQQHLDNAIFRCVENRRPLVRAANTGVTCFVNEFGGVTQTLRGANGSTFTEGVLTGVVQVPTTSATTFYTRHGEIFAKLCGCVALLFLFVRIALLVRRKAKAEEK